MWNWFNQVLTMLEQILLTSLKQLVVSEQILATEQAILKLLTPPPIVGIEVEPGIPSDKPKGSDPVAKFKVSLRKGASKAKAGGKVGAVVDFVIQDNQNDTCTVFGVDAAGNQADISAVATIAATSSDATVLTVAPPTGTTFKMTATGKLSTVGTPVNVGVTATWNDGSIGPFSFTLPVDVVAGPVSGVVIVPGTPVAN